MMRYFKGFLLLLFTTIVTCAKHNHIWPYPQTITQQDQYILIHVHEFSIVTDSKCDLVLEAIKRYNERMFVQDCGKLDADFKGKWFLDRRLNHVMDSNYKGILKNLTVKFTGECEHLPHMNMVEKYHLVVDETKAEIVGESVWGALRGLETFSQLLINVGRDEFEVNLVKIEDWPRFSHRGLLIDTSRHFLSVKSIFQTLDAMEMNKLNVLHWHIVDDQSFPFVSETFPELSAKGAYNPNTHVYHKKDVDEVLERARVRGIRVVSEFDSPGHTLSWGRAEKDLLTPCYGQDGRPNGQYGPVDPALDSAYTFIQKLFAEISHRFPEQYIHLGGDEVSFECWQSNPKIHDFMSKHGMGKDYAKLESYYIQKLLDIVKDLKKSYIVWQEVFDNNVTLKSDTVVHVWIGNDWQREMSRVTNKSFNVLLSAPWYLDYISYGSDWEKYYIVEPLDFEATDAQKKLVLGGEACIWAEFVNSANLIPRVWPRASAVAERLWSPASMKETSAAQPRFHEQYCRMMKQGLRVEPQDGPGWCQCDHAL